MVWRARAVQMGVSPTPSGSLSPARSPLPPLFPLPWALDSLERLTVMSTGEFPWPRTEVFPPGFQAPLRDVELTIHHPVGLAHMPTAQLRSLTLSFAAMNAAELVFILSQAPYLEEAHLDFYEYTQIPPLSLPSFSSPIRVLTLDNALMLSIFHFIDMPLLEHLSIHYHTWSSPQDPLFFEPDGKLPHGGSGCRSPQGLLTIVRRKTRTPLSTFRSGCRGRTGCKGFVFRWFTFPFYIGERSSSLFDMPFSYDNQLPGLDDICRLQEPKLRFQYI